MRLLFYTLKDIGIKRTFRRIIYKIRNFIDEFIYNKLKLESFINLFFFKNKINLKWKNKLSKKKNNKCSLLSSFNTLLGT